MADVEILLGYLGQQVVVARVLAVRFVMERYGVVEVLLLIFAEEMELLGRGHFVVAF